MERRKPRHRVNMRIPEDLFLWAKEYAHDNNTTMTQDFIDYLTEKRRESERKNRGSK